MLIRSRGWANRDCKTALPAIVNQLARIVNKSPFYNSTALRRTTSVWNLSSIFVRSALISEQPAPSSRRMDVEWACPYCQPTQRYFPLSFAHLNDVENFERSKFRRTIKTVGKIINACLIRWYKMLIWSTKRIDI